MEGELKRSDFALFNVVYQGINRHLNLGIWKQCILKMKLKRLLLRYYPPGIILEYKRKSGEKETKSIDLLNLSSE